MADFNIHNSRVDQITDSGTNIKFAEKDLRVVNWWERLTSWYGILGTTVTLLSALLALYVMHLQYGWWFFGAR